MKILILVIRVLPIEKIRGDDSFIISFQQNANGITNPSNSVWIEFSKQITSASSFTSCLWLKAKYFNKNIAIVLWAYCISEGNEEKVDCLQIFLDGDSSTAMRTVVIKAFTPNHPQYDIIHVPLPTYKHRTWGHLCWSFSSVSGENRFYYNGQSVGNVTNESAKRDIFQNVTGLKKHALIFGQEPDALRGGYNRYQSFIGDLTGFNIWDYILDEAVIKDMAGCLSWQKGNFIEWNKSEIVNYDAHFRNLENTSSLCERSTRYFVIPRKVLYTHAHDYCATHGGTLVTPRSKEENDMVKSMVHEHYEQCRTFSNGLKIVE